MNRFNVQISDERGDGSTTTITADTFKFEQAGVSFLRLVGGADEVDDPRGIRAELVGFVSFKNLVLIEKIQEPEQEPAPFPVLQFPVIGTGS